MMTIRYLVTGAIEELQERLEREKEHGCESEISEVIYQVADNRVPVYTRQLLEVAHSNIWLAVSEPELGPAFDGKPTPVNIIAANIYEYLTQELRNRVNEQDELLEEKKEPDGLDD